jgi:hypothetical protein
MDSINVSDEARECNVLNSGNRCTARPGTLRAQCRRQMDAVVIVALGTIVLGVARAFGLSPVLASGDLFNELCQPLGAPAGYPQAQLHLLIQIDVRLAQMDNHQQGRWHD